MNVAERLIEEGYEDVVIFKDYGYDSAFIDVTYDNRAVYDFEKMVLYLIEEEGFKDVTEALEWIEYNTLRALPYMGEQAPVVMYPLD